MKNLITSDNPMEENIVHLALSATNQMQAIPALIVFGLLVVFSLIASLSWGDQSLEAALLHLSASGLNWLSLWLLPIAGRSFGPDRPSTLILSFLFMLLMLILGLLNAPLWMGICFGIAMLAMVIYSTWIEPFRLGVTHQHYQYAGWEAGKPPLRVLQIGDIHIERITARERRLNQLIAELQPDIICFTGDFVNISYTYDPKAEADIREIIGAWQAPLGVYCVSGTHTVESLHRVREFVAELDNLRLLENEWVHLETPAGPLHILGMITTHLLRDDRETVRQLKADQPGPGMSLIFTHAPDVAPEADECGYDLYFCGHTHGGQIRFPIIGAVFSGSLLGMRFVMGRYDLNHMTLYTARGVGLEGMGAPRARFLCPPEIVLWEISGQA